MKFIKAFLFLLFCFVSLLSCSDPVIDNGTAGGIEPPELDLTNPMVLIMSQTEFKFRPMSSFLVMSENKELGECAFAGLWEDSHAAIILVEGTIHEHKDGTPFKIKHIWIDDKEFNYEWYAGYGETAKLTNVDGICLYEFKDQYVAWLAFHSPDHKYNKKIAYFMSGDDIIKDTGLKDYLRMQIWAPGTILVSSEPNIVDIFDFSGNLLLSCESINNWFFNGSINHPFVYYDYFCSLTDIVRNSAIDLTGNYIKYTFVRENLIKNETVLTKELTTNIPSNARTSLTYAVNGDIVNIEINYTTWEGVNGIKKYTLSMVINE